MNTNSIINNKQTMSSIEIAELTGKSHAHLMRDIRNMEPAWEKVCKSKFGFTSRTIIQPNGGTRSVPCYELTKTECLYIATKFNDEARAKLVLRWEELEMSLPRPSEGGEDLTVRAEFTEKRQMMLPSGDEIVRVANNIIGAEVRKENAPAVKCLTATEVAKQWGMNVKHFNRMLVSMGVQKRRNGSYYLDEKYEGLDLAEYRVYKCYSLDGNFKTRDYMVWTPMGVKWLEGMVKQELLLSEE